MSFNPEHAPPDLVVNQPEPPSEPAIEPTVRELLLWSAKVLGYSYSERYETWVSPKGDYGIDFRPYAFIEQAWLLLGKFKHWTMWADSDGFTCRVYLYSKGEVAEETDSIAPLAILRACYRAAQGKETQ